MLFMPTNVDIPEDVIINILRVFDLLFKAGILSDFISAFIKQKQCQKSAHSAVSVIKWVYTEKISNKRRDKYQRIYDLQSKRFREICALRTTSCECVVNIP